MNLHEENSAITQNLFRPNFRIRTKAQWRVTASTQIPLAKCPPSCIVERKLSEGGIALLQGLPADLIRACCKTLDKEVGILLTQHNRALVTAKLARRIGDVAAAGVQVTKETIKRVAVEHTTGTCTTQ